MWKKLKESEFFRKMKQVRVNRAVYLSSIVILLSLAVVLTVTAVSNRAKRNEGDANNTTAPSVTEPITPPTGNGGAQTPNDTPTDTPTTLPELTLPTSGKLCKNHSVDVQVFSETMQDWRVHLGIDIATALDAPVCAVADGSVERIWEDPMMGWCVALTHVGDCVTVYKNLSKDLAEGLCQGMSVKQGQLLGYVGDTAILELADEPHLHMEMTVGGLQVDPLEYFSESVLAALSQDSAYENESGK